MGGGIGLSGKCNAVFQVKMSQIDTVNGKKSEIF